VRLSIVATLYQSAVHLPEFHRRATAAARQVAGDDYEIVLVNDGSPDTSLTDAVALTEHDPHLVVVDLSRNFGHHKAMMTGLSYSKGDLVFLIDSDLEEDPELLISFAEQLERESCDVVYGVQEARRGPWLERFSGPIYYWLFRISVGIDLPRNVVTARLMARRYVDALLLHQEREVVMSGLWHITGFNQRPQIVVKHSLSETTYTTRHKLGLLVNMLTSFSSAPLRGIFFAGMAISTVSTLYITYLVVHWIFTEPATGWTSLMASIWLLGGLIIMFIGVIGIYLSKVFSEVKQRPYTIVREVHGQRRPDAG
jgi:putative glycosyltransferase